MRRFFAALAASALVVVGTAGGAFASHKSNSRHAPPPDCEIEVDALGVCLNL
jgi:hypothetical protein